MKGIVTKRFTHGAGHGVILGEDRNEYPFHYVHIIDNAHIKEGTRVEFDKKRMSGDGTQFRAGNIRKIGHGTRHPFIFCLKQLRDCVDMYVPYDEKMERFEDIDAMIRYFIVAEDCEEYPDIIGTFRKETK